MLWMPSLCTPVALPTWAHWSHCVLRQIEEFQGSSKCVVEMVHNLAQGNGIVDRWEYVKKILYQITFCWAYVDSTIPECMKDIQNVMSNS